MNKIIDILMIDESILANEETQETQREIRRKLAPFETKIIKHDDYKFYIMTNMTSSGTALIPDWVTILTACTDGIKTEIHMQSYRDYDPQVRESAIKQPIKDEVVHIYSRLKTQVGFSFLDFSSVEFKNEILLNLALNPKTCDESGIYVSDFIKLNEDASFETVSCVKSVKICGEGSLAFYDITNHDGNIPLSHVESTYIFVTDGKKVYIKYGSADDYDELKDEAIINFFKDCRSGYTPLNCKTKLMDRAIQNHHTHYSTDEKRVDDDTFHSFFVTGTPNYELDYALFLAKQNESEEYIYDVNSMKANHQTKYHNFVSFVVMRKGDKIVGARCSKGVSVRKFLTENFEKASHGDLYCWCEGEFVAEKSTMYGRILKQLVGERTELLNPYFDKQVKISQLPDIKQSGSCLVLKNDHGTGIFLTDEELKTTYCVEIEGKEVMHNGVPKEVLRKFNHSAQLSLVVYALDSRGVYIIPIEKIIRHVPKIEVGEYGGYYSI